MVEYNPDQLDAMFQALADRTRRAMLNQLALGPRTVGELAAPFAISLAAASKHIKVLERAGLLARAISGRSHVCSLDARPMHGGLEWIRHYERFWNERLDALESALRAEDACVGPGPDSGSAHRPRTAPATAADEGAARRTQQEKPS